MPLSSGTMMVKKLETFRNVFKLERKLQFMNPQISDLHSET
jgi:hypothetical protein